MDRADRRAHAAALPVHIHPEATHFRNAVGKVQFEIGEKVLFLVVIHHALNQPENGCRIKDRKVCPRDQASVDTHYRMIADLEMQVRSPTLIHLDPEAHDLHRSISYPRSTDRKSTPLTSS